MIDPRLLFPEPAGRLPGEPKTLRQRGKLREADKAFATAIEIRLLRHFLAEERESARQKHAKHKNERKQR